MKRSSLLAAAAAAALLLLLAGGPVAADPPGNNGTIKVDGVDIESVPDNDPHVGCTFTIEFAGYDKGADMMATVDFQLQPPTTRPSGSQLLLHDDVFIGEDAAGGATDLDAKKVYSLDFTGVPQQLLQGYHVKLTIHAPAGSIGADKKFKVFWVTPCLLPPPTTTTTTTTAPPTTTTTAPGATTTTTAAVAATTTTPATVLGETITNEAPAGELPKTGASDGLRALLVLGAILVVIGASTVGAVRLAGRRSDQ